MLFQSRHRSPWLTRTLAWIWPRRGMVRSTRYLLRRLQRIPGTPHRLATGFACGAALSMTPFVGLHGVVAVVLAWILGGSWVTALIGTAVGNPWTFPLIWIVSFQTGTLILPGATNVGMTVGAVTDELLALVSAAANLVIRWDFDTAVRDLESLRLLPTMTVGSIPFVVAAWIIAYFLVRSSIAQYQRLRYLRIRSVRQKRLARRRHHDGAL